MGWNYKCTKCMLISEYKINILNMEGIGHLLGIIVEDIYGFMPIYSFDKLYMLSFITIPFSWVICNDECIISYMIKKRKNKNYILGTEPNNVSDISNIFPSKKHYFVFYNISNVLRICSVYFVNKRTTHIQSSILVPTCILFLCYNYDISYNLQYRKILYPYFHIILCGYLFAFFLNLK